MNVIATVIARLVGELCARGRIDLAPGATEALLVEELLARIEGAPSFAQVGPFLGRVLVESRYVDEIYADDREIVEMLNQARP